MPTVINGIGTWYYGKRNLSTRHDVCDQCGRPGALSSYDTTLYFVVVFLPLIPLGTKRIIDSCPSCNKHRSMSLKEWEHAKSEKIGDGAIALSADPDNAEVACKAMAAAIAFAAKDEFLGLAASLSAAVLKSADVQSVLFAGMERFGMNEPARAAAEAAVRLDPASLPRKHELAVHLLQHHTVDDAAPVARAVIAASPTTSQGLLYLLVEALQAEGWHAEARLELESAAAKGVVSTTDKDFKRYSKLAAKHETSGKKINSPLIRPGAPVQSKGGSSFWLPRILAACIALLIVSGYFMSAIYRGQSRELWLVSGLSSKARYSIDGGPPVLLQPLIATKVKLAEGAHTIKPLEPGSPIPEQSFSMETNFFTRPFSNVVFVVNPDRLALLLRETHTYSTSPGASASPVTPEFLGPDLLHDVRGVDYPFTPAPQQLKMKSNESKTRVSLAVLQDASPVIIADITQTNKGKPAAAELLSRGVLFEPEAEPWFIALRDTLEPAVALDAVKPLLERRPLLVQSHRVYQDLTKVRSPSTDLLAEYAKIDKESQSAQSAYLLGRVTEDWPAAAALYERACKEGVAGKPVAIAARSLAHHAMQTGDNEASLRWAARALEIDPDIERIQELRVAALQGLGRYVDALATPLLAGDPANDDLETAIMRIVLLVQAGKPDKAGAHINTFTSDRLGSEEAASFARARLESVLHYAAGNMPRFIESESSAAAKTPFVDYSVAIAKGDAAAAATAFDAAIGTPEESSAVSAGIGHLTVYLAAQLAENKTLAGEQFAKALSSFRLAGADASEFLPILEGNKPPSADQFASAKLHRANIALICAALAYEQPATRAITLPLARKLNVEPEFPSLTIKSAIEALERK